MSTPLPYRIGHGYDLHRLKSGGQLLLGSVIVSSEMSPIAHSDGDVVLHALVDAILGSMGWGDIGEHFPNDDPEWRDVPSRVFVDTVFAKLQHSGYRVGNVDVLILAERPRLNTFKPAIRQAVAKMLDVAPDQVNIKAGTNEECDAIGRGEAIAADVTLLVLRS